MLASRRLTRVASVTSSLALAMISPVSGVDHVGGQGAPDQEVVGHRDLLQAGRFQVADVLGGDALVLGDDHLARPCR